jgi:formate dehydrogenase maturation protein FdhE
LLLRKRVELKKIIPMVSIVIILGVLVWFFIIDNEEGGASKQEITQLQHMGDECVGISEKAVMGMAPVVEFQKLELQSRKANVLKNCMADRGFHEDPAWRKYATPLAKIIASKQKISSDEAIETMRKADMLIFKKQAQRPLYWQASKS